MLPMTIRRFETGDEITIARLEAECFSAPWSEKTILDEASSGSVFLVAQSQNEVIGYISCRLILGEGYINNIAVAREHRKKGVARALLAETERIARKQNAEFLTLEVRQSNLPAIRLYEGCGYTQTGVRRGFYQRPTEDALLLTLFLGEKQ